MAGARGDTFGTRLRRREAAALTQEELAARAGLSAKSIGALERGERAFHERAIAAARDQLGEAAWQAAWDTGRALPFAPVVALAQGAV